jgi:hypothetical protein
VRLGGAGSEARVELVVPRGVEGRARAVGVPDEAGRRCRGDEVQDGREVLRPEGGQVGAQRHRPEQWTVAARGGRGLVECGIETAPGIGTRVGSQVCELGRELRVVADHQDAHDAGRREARGDRVPGERRRQATALLVGQGRQPRLARARRLHGQQDDETVRTRDHAQIFAGFRYAPCRALGVAEVTDG